MDAGERDKTDDWVVPTEAVPPLLGELELKVDEALAIARSSEDAVNVVGAAALDAADQARRAASLAESASEIALEASRGGSAPGGGGHPATDGPAAAARSEGDGAPRGAAAGTAARVAIASRRPEPAAHAGPASEDPLERFVERADLLAARLRAV